MLLAFVVSLFLSLHGYYTNKLSLDGAITAFIVGFAHFMNGPFYASTLIIFYLMGSLATKWKAEYKQKFDGEYKIGGQRDASQVLCSSLWTFLLCSIQILFPDLFFNSKSITFFIGVMSCCLGDTLASEIGVMSKQDPILITTFKRVPRGTNGAISLLGTFACILGSLLLALLTLPFLYWSKPNMYSYLPQMIILYVSSSLFGMFLDSYLGATLQATFIKDEKIYNHHINGSKKIQGILFLTNEQVNLLSSLFAGLFSLFLYEFLINKDFQY